VRENTETRGRAAMVKSVFGNYLVE
jgi:hypothetical protein